MEGPSLREYPRMVLAKPVELRVEKKAIKMKEAGNLSVSGLYVEGEKLPVGTAVHVTVSSSPPVDVDGVVRYAGDNGHPGVGIEFTHVTEANRKRLELLIADITRQGAPAS